MSGRRSTGAAAAIIGDVYQKSVNRRLDQDKERREFNQRLQELGIKAGIESGALSPVFTGGQVGFQQNAPLQPLTMQGLSSQLGMGGSSVLGTPQAQPQLVQGPQAMPQQAPMGQPRDEQGQFTTTITQDLDQYGRMKGFKVTRNEVKPKELSPRDQLFQPIQQAQGQLTSAQQAIPRTGSILAQPAQGFGVSERVLSERPQNLQRAQPVFQERQVQAMGQLQSAQSQMQGLQAQAGALNQSGLLGTPGVMTQPDDSNAQTQSAIEDIQSGRASIDEFLANEEALQASGVDTQAIRQLLGL